jgi:hypothetical protein
MSTMNTVVTRIHSPRLSQWRKNARPLAATSSAFGARDLAAVVVISAIGLAVSLFFVRVFPGGLSAFIAPMP